MHHACIWLRLDRVTTIFRKGLNFEDLTAFLIKQHLAIKNQLKKWWTPNLKISLIGNCTQFYVFINKIIGKNLKERNKRQFATCSQFKNTMNRNKKHLRKPHHNIYQAIHFHFSWWPNGTTHIHPMLILETTNKNLHFKRIGRCRKTKHRLNIPTDTDTQTQKHTHRIHSYIRVWQQLDIEIKHWFG